MPGLDDVDRTGRRLGLAAVVVDHVQPATRDGPDMAGPADSAPTTGLIDSDQRQPGWNVTRAAVSVGRRTTSIPVLSGVLVSSGWWTKPDAMPAMVVPPL